MHKIATRTNRSAIKVIQLGWHNEIYSKEY